MENLNLEGGGGGGAPMGQQQPLGPGPGPGLPAGPPQQLPPQMFTTAAQLLDMTDKKLMVSLRDGRKLIGVLRSWDQFANIVLQSTIERKFFPPTGTSPGLYADVSHGIFLVRGENVLLLGEIDLDKDDDPPLGYEKAEIEVVERLIKEKKTRDSKKEKAKLKRLAELGFEGENLGEAIL
ncbi:hypothetical protein F5884DRAFT_783383 [Xylogone sp. PMI_703]|nr:hypothetical protein F5884DRAFT_783383 [Xylogone sp. PMI_703]